MAVDTTVASVLRRDGAQRPKCANEDGAGVGGKRKEGTYPELTGREADKAGLSWPARLGDGGPRKLKTSSALWPAPKPEASHRI